MFNNAPVLKTGYVLEATGDLAKNLGEDGREWKTLFARSLKYLGTTTIVPETTEYRGFPTDNHFDTDVAF